MKGIVVRRGGVPEVLPVEDAPVPSPAGRGVLVRNQGSPLQAWSTLGDYTRKREDLLCRASDMPSWIAHGTLQVEITPTFPSVQAAAAHRLLESRALAGKSSWFPDPCTWIFAWSA